MKILLLDTAIDSFEWSLRHLRTFLEMDSKFEHCDTSTAVAMAEVLEIDRSLLFDEFAQFMDYPYNNRLREVRKVHKLNPATFAEKAGISLSIYSKWESGSRQPSRKMYQQLVNTYPEINI